MYACIYIYKINLYIFSLVHLIFAFPVQSLPATVAVAVAVADIVVAIAAVVGVIVVAIAIAATITIIGIIA